jgi:hypothetical protein
MSDKQVNLFDIEPVKPAPAPRPARPDPKPVQAPAQARLCLWPGCKVEVQPKLWGCKDHWCRLPQHLRTRILATYRAGQESNRLLITRAYVEAAGAAQEWIKRHGGKV